MYNNFRPILSFDSSKHTNSHSYDIYVVCFLSSLTPIFGCEYVNIVYLVEDYESL